MPRNSTYPDLFDDAYQLKISKLKEWGYLKSGQIINADLTWSRNGIKTGSISIKVETWTENPFINLNYKYGEKPMNYKVNLVTGESNLKKGKIWYFLCPVTNKRCRILYSIGGVFLHRTAHKGSMYDCQTKSHSYRNLGKLFDKAFGDEKAYDEIYKKYFKSHYAGKPTKKYLRLMRKIKISEGIPYTEKERLFYK